VSPGVVTVAGPYTNNQLAVSYAAARRKGLFDRFTVPETAGTDTPVGKSTRTFVDGTPTTAPAAALPVTVPAFPTVTNPA